MKYFILFLISSFLSLLFVSPAYAKVLPQALAKSGKATSLASSGITIGVSPRLRSDRKALLVNFTSLQNALAVSYMLTYTGNETAQGAGGSLTLDGSSTASRELLFGTCSTHICTYHDKITNAKFEVTTQLKD